MRIAVCHGNGLFESLLDPLSLDVMERFLSQATLRYFSAAEAIRKHCMRSEDVG
jgi:hypothetical protein